ncbi:hypothetical protein C1Y40_00774 [Mycobacterium talmoniae]|uniref:Uncharacterized protein n=1 Tax=Mycobacterium talmoniae TaxID=1858794 RepID=A0A2S8BQU3_9MYCO|nr:hypothetical protein C1Y40_00774 [Mycobacterium talmoniae]
MHRPDPGLNLLGTQHAGNLNIELGLADPGRVAAQRRTQPIIGPDFELVVGILALADDVFAIDVESNDLEFPHDNLLRGSQCGL